MMPIFHESLEKFRHLPMVGDVRYIGMIGAVELVKDKNTKGRFDFNERIGLKIYKKGLKRSVILRPLGDIVYLFLPLCVNRDDIEYITSRTYDLIKYI